MDGLEQSGVSLRVLNLGLDTCAPSGRLLVTVLAAVARLEVDLLSERTRSGLAHARKSGTVLGRPRVLTPAQMTEAKRMAKHLSPREIGGVLGCSERTIRRVINEEGEK